MKLRATALLAAGLAVGGVWAGEGNYRDYIVGERAAGMGGAALGLATSVESCFFNPGGLPYTDSSTVSLSASLYGFADYTVDDGWGPGKNIDVDSFLVVPTTFGSVWKLNRDWAFALSAFVPDMARSNDLEAYVNQYDYFKYNKDDQSLWLGPSAGVRIDDRFSVGISVFGVYRTYSWFRDIIRAATYTWSEDIKYNDLSILALLGARYQLSPNWILGVTFQAPSVHLTGSGEYLIKYSYGDGNLVNYVDDVDTCDIDVNLRIYRLPTSTAAYDDAGSVLEFSGGYDIKVIEEETTINGVHQWNSFPADECYEVHLLAGGALLD
nr:hypothetical protein [bacterium]